MEKPKIKLSEMTQDHLNKKLSKLSVNVSNYFGKEIASQFEGENMQFVLDNLSQVLLHSFTGMLVDLYQQAYIDGQFNEEKDNFIEFVVKNTEFKLNMFFNSLNNKKDNK